MTQEEEHEEEEKEEAKKTGDVGRGQTKENGNVKGDVRHPLPASQRDNTAGETPRSTCGGGRGEEGSCGEVVVVRQPVQQAVQQAVSSGDLAKSGARSLLHRWVLGKSPLAREALAGAKAAHADTQENEEVRRTPPRHPRG